MFMECTEMFCLLLKYELYEGKKYILYVFYSYHDKLTEMQNLTRVAFPKRTDKIFLPCR